MTSHSLFLVDDDEDDIFLARLTFETHFSHWQLTCFSDGQALVDALSEEAPPTLPRLILLDLNMPRLTGFETLTALKRNPDWASVPVAILTTSSNPEDRDRSLELGAYAFITKPATIDQLAKLIDLMLPA
jgi:CheY-like chemotaxis protein